ncbi:MAG: hypothetical protein JO065_02085 [Acidobacteria bacterium]|nr:hypothetical protein [Acidobacteriota bacterium]
MISPASFWPTALGIGFLVAGLCTYRRELIAESSAQRKFIVLGPVFVAASLAAFAGEHFTAARSLVALVPKWLPARLFIAYFVGVAHLAAALSLVARRCIRWSAFFLAVMFALFVLLLHFPGALRHPHLRIAWIVSARETTFSLGALSLFATAIRSRSPNVARRVAGVARVWTGMVLIFFGIENILYPQFSPGVPDTMPTASWIPLPHVLAYLTGVLLIAFGIAMLARKYAVSGGASAGLLMLLLTLALYVPQFFLAGNVADRVNAINFIFDTLLFSGTMLLVTKLLQAASELLSF